MDPHKLKNLIRSKAQFFHNTYDVNVRSNLSRMIMKKKKLLCVWVYDCVCAIDSSRKRKRVPFYLILSRVSIEIVKL